MLITLILCDPPQAHVYFSPTLDQQKKCSDCEGTLIDGDLFIKYDVIHPQDIGEIQVQYQQNQFFKMNFALIMHYSDGVLVFLFQIVNGYFVHFFAPDNLPQMPKNVVFVIDRSGSMEGEKMKQAGPTNTFHTFHPLS